MNTHTLGTTPNRAHDRSGAMGSVESVAQSLTHDHGTGERIPPDSEWCLSQGSNEHGAKFIEVGNLLREMHEKVRALSMLDKPVNDGTLLEMSTKLTDVFNLCEGIEKDAALNGAVNLGFAVLTKHPDVTKCRSVCELLFDEGFCISLTNLKVELIRIARGEPESGPWLTNDEERQLERWGEELANGAMMAWIGHFAGLGWPPAWGIEPNPDEDPFDVPDPFRTLVCNLVSMRLNLWPTIKDYLDKWEVKGENIFPSAYWNDQTFLNTIVLEPRMIPWIIGVHNIDMHELAIRDRYTLRSNYKHQGTYDALEQRKKDLVWTGVHYMRESKTGPQKRQRPSEGRWHATQYKWPRTNMPQPRDLIGCTAWASH